MAVSKNDQHGDASAGNICIKVIRRRLIVQLLALRRLRADSGADVRRWGSNNELILHPTYF